VVDLCDRAFQDTPREYFERHVLGDPTLRPEDTLVLVKDGRFVSSVQMFPRTYWVEGRTMKFGGIGNVSTDPAERKHGYAGLLMAEAVRRMRDLGYAFSMLTTGINSYYEKFGYVTVPRRAMVFRGLSPKRAPGVRQFARKQDFGFVRAIYEKYNGELAGPVVRDERYWQGQFDFCGEDPDKFLVLERDGRVTGYIRGNIEKGLLQVLEFGALEDIPATCEALIRSLASRSVGTPVKMMVSDRERESLAPGLTHVIEEDTAMMILVLDDRERARLERTILRPGMLTFWLSDFF
jgi:predicted acetyltransferase